MEFYYFILSARYTDSLQSVRDLTFITEISFTILLSLHTSQVAHQARAYLGFHSMKGIYTPGWKSKLSCTRTQDNVASQGSNSELSPQSQVH